MIGAGLGSREPKRKLAAILSADVAGYSRLMGDDDAATVKAVKAHRKMMIKLIEARRGRAVDAKGDNLLARFDSAVEAVRCAVEIQQGIAKLNLSTPLNRRMEWRLGLNLGDVIEDGGTIYGDGVNVAARLEGLARAGQVLISRAVHDLVKKSGLAFKDFGSHAVKNIREPVRVFRVLIDETGTPEEVDGPDRAPPLPVKPSIAVLPLAGIGSDPESEHLADGITENIITALSHVSELFVIARNSSFIYKGRPVKVQEAGLELGVRYILEGSLQKAGDRIRVNVQLVDAPTGHHLWADRYDRDLKDIFALQDEITREIVVALQVNLTEGEQARLRYRSTLDLQAWGFLVQAIGYFNRFTREGNLKARELSQRARKIDPDNAMVLALLAWTYLMDSSFGAEKSRSGNFARAIELADRASSLDDSLAEANSVQSYIQSFRGDYERALKEGAKGIALAPNSANIRAVYAHTLLYAGEFKEALGEVDRALRLSPYYPDYFLIIQAWAQFMDQDFRTAAGTWRRHLRLVERRNLSPRRSIVGHLGLAACLQALGQEEAARSQAREVLRINPGFDLKNVRRFCPFREDHHLEGLLETLRRTGLK
jgi:adenylate cyclase